MWHRDFPPEGREMWDILAKALLLRLGDYVHVSADELRVAREAAAEVEIDQFGGIRFRIVAN
jgi:hypothetical protein